MDLLSSPEVTYKLLKDNLPADDFVVQGFNEGKSFEHLFGKSLELLIKSLQGDFPEPERISENNQRIYTLSKLAFILYSNSTLENANISEKTGSSLFKYETEVCLSVNNYNFVFGENYFKWQYQNNKTGEFKHLLHIFENEYGEIQNDIVNYDSP